MSRMLVIPAAGRGSRLGWDGPKALCPIGGRPMLDWILDRYAGVVDRVVIVAAPAAVARVRAHIAGSATPIDIAVQEEPTGMLPAILCAQHVIAREQPDQVWITWCDQLGISDTTVARLANLLDADDSALVFPTVRQSPPYIHFARESDGRIARVLQRREGDAMPAAGESDAGLFALKGETYLGDLPAYGALAPESGGTRERNFLPFIPWLSARKTVRTFDLIDPREALGVNTPDDLRAMENYLRDRA
jgi:bifunctional N-acetylglucosamine-1-phosphate-uridyltransferase/glucosamine-1-phosphate-acetyltransferase GlmU-like protein